MTHADDVRKHTKLPSELSQFLWDNGMFDKLSHIDIVKLESFLHQVRKGELNHIWREVVKNDVAGPVKWEIEDRIAAIDTEAERSPLDTDERTNHSPQRELVQGDNLGELKKTEKIVYNKLTTHKTYSPEDYPTDDHFIAACIAAHIHKNFVLKDHLQTQVERAKLEAQIKQLKHWVKQGYIPDDIAASTIGLLTAKLEALTTNHKDKEKPL